MDSVLRGLVVYFFLLVIVRISGKRTLAQTTHFELVLLLIISETTQQAMVDNDHSITNAFLLIMTLVGTSIILSYLKELFPSLEDWMDGIPNVVISKGEMNNYVMVDKDDILAAARASHGLERLDEIKYAIVERSGEITIVPWKQKEDVS